MKSRASGPPPGKGEARMAAGSGEAVTQHDSGNTTARASTARVMVTAMTMAPQIHPLALGIPEMLRDEYVELVADIQAHGQREPIHLYDGMILDGRNRARACAELGIEVKAITFTGTVAEAKALVVSANVHRRHLTLDQKQKVIAAELKLDPAQSDRAIAKKAKASPTTVGKARAGAEPNVHDGHKPARNEASGRKARGRKPGAHARPVAAACETASLREARTHEAVDIVADGTAQPVTRSEPTTDVAPSLIPVQVPEVAVSPIVPTQGGISEQLGIGNHRIVDAIVDEIDTLTDEDVLRVALSALHSIFYNRDLVSMVPSDENLIKALVQAESDLRGEAGDARGEPSP
jgi:ParB-like chromosome segregation protein Spo0J